MHFRTPPNSYLIDGCQRRAVKSRKIRSLPLALVRGHALASSEFTNSEVLAKTPELTHADYQLSEDGAE